MKVWVGDRLVDEDAATVHISDHGLTVGDGVFESTIVRDGVAFALTRHLDRLQGSAAALGLHVDPRRVRDAVAAVLAANDTAGRLRLRVTVTGGPGPYGSDRGAATPTLLVALAAAKQWPRTADVVVVPWLRNERSAVAGVKTTSYAENVVALAYAHARGAAEAVFANTVGQLCEGTGSNIFVVTGGQLLTPPLSSGCLAGVTRGLVLEWCAVEEADIAIEELAGAQEVFLTSATRDVQPVATVDGRHVASAPGPVTSQVMATFARHAADDVDP